MHPTPIECAINCGCSSDQQIKGISRCRSGWRMMLSHKGCRIFNSLTQHNAVEPGVHFQRLEHRLGVKLGCVCDGAFFQPPAVDPRHPLRQPGYPFQQAVCAYYEEITDSGVYLDDKLLYRTSLQNSPTGILLCLKLSLTSSMSVLGKPPKAVA